MLTERQRRERHEQLVRVNAWLSDLRFRRPLTFSLLPLFFAVAVLAVAMLLKTLVTK